MRDSNVPTWLASFDEPLGVVEWIYVAPISIVM